MKNVDFFEILLHFNSSIPFSILLLLILTIDEFSLKFWESPFIIVWLANFEIVNSFIIESAGILLIYYLNPK